MSAYTPLHDSFLKTEYDGFRYMMFSIPIAIHAKIIVETGLSRGFSTQILCEASKLIGARVFTYDIVDSPTTRDRLKSLGLDENWTFLLKDSVEGGKGWEEEKWGKVDLLFLDSDHSSEHVKSELKAWTPRLSPMGIIMIHDTYNPDSSKRPDTALTGILEFIKETDEKWLLLNLTHPCGMAVIIRKGD